jgi:hypothetical protein
MTSAQPSVASLREFLREHPESDFSADAQRSLDLVAFKNETTVKHLGIRVEVAPNAAQPQRVRRGFVSVVARQYREHGIEVTLIPTGSEPTPDMQGWIRLDYDEAQASGTFGGATIVARCRVRLYNRASPKEPIWDRTFEAPAEHILKTYGRDKTVFGNSRYPFWKQFFVPVSTWASTEAARPAPRLSRGRCRRSTCAATTWRCCSRAVASICSTSPHRSTRAWSTAIAATTTCRAGTA